MASYIAKGIAGQPDSLKITVWPDSAILKTGKPVFLSDEYPVRIHAGYGVKITGVGKSISSRFAHKYFDDMIPLIFFLSEGVSKQISEGEDPKACDIVADFSIVEGKPIISNEAGENDTLEISLSTLYDQKEIFSETVQTNLQTIKDSIATAGIRNTIKTGDIVGFILPEGHEAAPDTLITVSQNGKILLENKLK